MKTLSRLCFSLVFLLALCVGVAHAQSEGDVVNGDTLNYSGWSSKAAASAKSNSLSATLQGNISTRANLFDTPACLWSYATVAVSENGQAVNGLDESNFSVTEDGGAVCDYFVNQAGTQGGGQVDFVFAVDNSGSMGGDQSDIDDALDDFATALDNSGLDFRIGLTRYGQTGDGCTRSTGGAPIWEDDCNASFYSDAIFYRDNIWTQNIAFGGNEPGYEAIVESVNQFPWRATAQKIVIIVTDETLAQDTDVADEDDALTALNDLGATLYGVTPSNGESQIRALSDPTGGDWFELREDPWTDILDDITTQVASLYTVGFRPCTDLMTPPMSRNVEITVNANSSSSTLNTSYTPGERPQGRRAPATAALQNVPAGTNLTLTLETRDFVGAAVSSATLFYRTTGTSSYSTVSMTDLGGGDFEGTIPGGDVAEPGIDYYYQFSDGTGSFTAPANDPVANPFQIGVGTNSSPQITHTPPTSITNGTPVPISAEVTDDGSVGGVTLFYRQQGRIGYQSTAMSNTGGNTYEGSIPGSVVTDAGLDYYIAASDNDGVTRTEGTGNFPIVLGGCNPLSGCDVPLLGSDEVDNNARTVSNTIEDNDGIDQFAFTKLVNFTVANFSPSSGFTAADNYNSDGTSGSDGKSDTWTWNGMGDPPTSVEFTLQAGSSGEARYFLEVTDACSDEAKTTDFDPIYDLGPGLAGQIELESYPNPFAEQATISFGLTERTPVTMAVYNITGRKVATLINSAKAAGSHEVRWNGRTDRGRSLSSGVYLVRLKAGDRTEVQRVTIVR